MCDSTLVLRKKSDSDIPNKPTAAKKKVQRKRKDIRQLGGTSTSGLRTRREVHQTQRAAEEERMATPNRSERTSAPAGTAGTGTSTNGK